MADLGLEGIATVLGFVVLNARAERANNVEAVRWSAVFIKRPYSRYSLLVIKCFFNCDVKVIGTQIIL